MPKSIAKGLEGNKATRWLAGLARGAKIGFRFDTTALDQTMTQFGDVQRGIDEHFDPKIKEWVDVLKLWEKKPTTVSVPTPLSPTPSPSTSPFLTPTNPNPPQQNNVFNIDVGGISTKDPKTAGRDFIDSIKESMSEITNLVGTAQYGGK